MNAPALAPKETAPRPLPPLYQPLEAWRPRRLQAGMAFYRTRAAAGRPLSSWRRLGVRESSPWEKTSGEHARHASRRRDATPILPERLLAKLWMARAGRRMRLTDGRRLRVVYPGRPAPGHGPDFLDAVIEIDGNRVHGSVELHRTPRDWAAHGHSSDPAYDNVVLHVVASAAGQGGPNVPTLVMPQDATEEEPPTLPSPALPLARLAALDEHALRMALRQAGLARLRERTSGAERAIAASGVEQALYARIMEALGYSENRAPFLELARRLPAAMLRAAALAYPPERRPTLLRQLMGPASGLEPPSIPWLQLGGAAPMERAAWRLAGVRPSNHPLRRMDAAAALLAAALPHGLAQWLAKACMAGPAALVEALRSPDSVRASHPASGTHRLGEQRAREVAVNAVLPVLLAWARSKNDRALAAACVKAYEYCPSLGENTVTREARRLLGDRGLRMRLSACEHQGLMRLYRQAVAGR